jgi:uncharacterized protein
MAFDRGHRKIYHARLMYARPFINSLDFARNGRRISGEVKVAELPRMHDTLEDTQGILSYTVQGGVDKQGTHFLDVNVVGQCRLLCQRCLNGMDYPVQLDTRLLLRDQASLDTLDDKVSGGEDEEFDSILAVPHMDLLELLEEEILLSLPIAPKHEIGACRATDGESRYEERRPFAGLAKLKSH